MPQEDWVVVGADRHGAAEGAEDTHDVSVSVSVSVDGATCGAGVVDAHSRVLNTAPYVGSQKGEGGVYLLADVLQCLDSGCGDCAVGCRQIWVGNFQLLYVFGYNTKMEIVTFLVPK